MALPVEIEELLEELRAHLQDADEALGGFDTEFSIDDAQEHIEAALNRLTEVEEKRRKRTLNRRGGCSCCHGVLDGYRNYPFLHGSFVGKICDECATELGLFRKCIHDSPYIDNCWVCAPRWEKRPCYKAGEIIDDLHVYGLLRLDVTEAELLALSQPVNP